MLADFVNRLEELCRKNELPRLIKLPGDAAHVHRLIDKDGSIHTIPCEPQPHAHQVASLDGMVGLLNTLFPKDGPAQCLPTVWASQAGVEAVFDPGQRNRATLQVRLSEPFARLQRLATTRQALSQKELIALLRLDFYKYLSKDSSALLTAAKKITFRKTTETTGEVARERASVGRKIEAEVAGGGPVPEIVYFLVPVWAGLPRLAHIECAVLIDFEEGHFRLVPFEQSLSEQLQAAEEWLCQRLREGISNTAIPIFHGRP